MGIGAGVVGLQALTPKPAVTPTPTALIPVKPIVTSPLEKPLWDMWDAASAEATSEIAPTLDQVTSSCGKLQSLVRASANSYAHGATPILIHNTMTSSDINEPTLVALMDRVMVDVVEHPERTADSQAALFDNQCRQAAPGWLALHHA